MKAMVTCKKICRSCKKTDKLRAPCSK